MRPESLSGRAPAAVATVPAEDRPADAPRGTLAAAETRAAALALVLAFTAVVLLPAASLYFVKVLRVPQAAVLPFAVPAAALALLAALALACWRRGADEASGP